MQTKTKSVFSCITLAVCMLLCINGPALRAQGGGSITGTVVDQAGKAIQGATVTVKNDNGSAAGTATTDADGKFSATGLAAASYSVETSAPGFALNSRKGVAVTAGTPQDLAVTLFVDAVSQSVTVQERVSVAEELAPMGNTLDTTSAKTEISTAQIHDFMAPVADFAEVMQQAPNSFSVNPNGIGLGQGKSYFRGFQDGQYTMTFDGIPFEDTNTPTHHSWASFPSQWISSTDFDRSPGQASDFGPTNFGGSINMKSPELQADPDIRGTFGYGSFNTRLYSLDFDSGLLGPAKKDAVLVNINAMTSDGYQTYNYQKRDAGYGKYQHRFSPRSSLTLYGGVVDIFNNTPDTTNATRDAIAKYGDNYLMDNTPICQANIFVGATQSCTLGQPDPYYYGYEHYHVQTDFEYASYTMDFGNGWKVDTKAFTTRYWNKQFLDKNFVMNLSTSKPSGVDKLNGYRHAGDTFIVSHESAWGTFRAGAWYDWAYTDRYQYPSNPVTQLDTPFPNFHEHFITESFQPFAEYEWRPVRKLAITAGIKAADYKMDLNQYQDVKPTVGCLGGATGKDPVTGAPICIGGAAFVSHQINYNSWLPTLTARYAATDAWSMYAQFAEGSVIPPSGVFDVTGGIVLTPPKPTIAKTYQIGSVLKHNRWTFDADMYYVHFQNGYDSYYDPLAADTLYVATGPSNTKGIEAESNIALGYGFSIYGNASFGSAKYQTGHNIPNGGEWVANTPTDIEGLNLLYQHRNWDIGYVFKRIGSYWQDNGSLNYAINGQSIPYPVDMAAKIDPWSLVNLFFNYTVKGSSFLRGSKLQLAVNNLANSHALVGLTPGNGPTLAVPYAPAGTDQLNLLPGRSFTLTITGGYAPKK